MNNFLSSYIKFLLRPRRNYQSSSLNQSCLSLGNLILSGWVFYSVSSFFNISLIIFFKSRAFSFFYFDKGIFDLTFESQVRMTLIVYLIGIMLFPFFRLSVFYIYKAVTQIIDKGYRPAGKNNFDPLTQFLIADIFYLVPFIGRQLRFIFSLYYLYSGLREGFRLGSVSSIMIIVFPFILVSFFAVFLLLLGVVLFL